LGQVIKAGAPSSVAVYAAVTDPIWTAKLSQAEKMTGTDQSGILKTRRIAPEQVSDAVTNAFARARRDASAVFTARLSGRDFERRDCEYRARHVDHRCRDRCHGAVHRRNEYQRLAAHSVDL
jgi:hypothetical protein